MFFTACSSFPSGISIYASQAFLHEAIMLRTLVRQSTCDGGIREVTKQITSREKVSSVVYNFSTPAFPSRRSFSHFLLRKRPLNFINGRPTAESSRPEKKNYETFTNSIRSITSRRQSINIPSQEDDFFRPSKLRPIPPNFPHVSVTSLREADAIFSRHLADALSVVPTLDALALQLGKRHTGMSIVDVGSGGGLPGIVIAIMRPEYKVVAIDSVGKKCDFMNAVAQRLELTNFTAVKGNAEILTQPPQKASPFLSPKLSGKMKTKSEGVRAVLAAHASSGGPISATGGFYRESFDVAVSRGLASLDLLAELCLGFVCVGGYMLCQKSLQASSHLSFDDVSYEQDASSPYPSSTSLVSSAPGSSTLAQLPTYSFSSPALQALLKEEYHPVPTPTFSDNWVTKTALEGVKNAGASVARAADLFRVESLSPELSSTTAREAVRAMGAKNPWEFVFCEPFLWTGEQQGLLRDHIMNGPALPVDFPSSRDLFDRLCGTTERHGRVVKGERFVYRILLSIQKTEPTPDYLPRSPTQGLGTSMVDFLASRSRQEIENEEKAPKVQRQNLVTKDKEADQWAEEQSDLSDDSDLSDISDISDLSSDDEMAAFDERRARS